MKYNLYISVFAISLSLVRRFMRFSTVAFTILFLLSTSVFSVALAGTHGGIVTAEETIKNLDAEKRKLNDTNSESHYYKEPGETRNSEEIEKESQARDKKRNEAKTFIKDTKNEIEGLIAGNSLMSDPRKGPANNKYSRPYVQENFTPGIINAAKDYKESDSFQYREKVNELLSGLTDKSMKNLKDKMSEVVTKLGLTGKQKEIFEQSVKAWGNTPEQNRIDLESKDLNTKMAATKAIEGKFKELARANPGSIPNDFRLPGDDKDALKSKAYLLERQPLQEELKKETEKTEKTENINYKKASEIQKNIQTLSENALKEIEGATHEENLAAFKKSSNEKTNPEKQLYSEITAAAKVLTDKKEVANSSAQSSNSSTATSATESKPTPTTDPASPKKSSQLGEIVKNIDDTQDVGSKVDTAVKNAAATAKKTVEGGSPYIPAAKLLKSVLGLTEAGAKAGVGKAVLNAANNVHVEKNYDDPSKKIHKEVLAINEAAKDKKLSNFKASADGGNLGYQSAKDGKNMDAVTMFTAEGSSIKATFAADLNDTAYVKNEKNETFATYKTSDGTKKYLAVEKNSQTNQWQQKKGALLSNVTEYAGAAQQTGVSSPSPPSQISYDVEGNTNGVNLANVNQQSLSTIRFRLFRRGIGGRR